jgi:hypothetical protein
VKNKQGFNVDASGLLFINKNNFIHHKPDLVVIGNNF